MEGNDSSIVRELTGPLRVLHGTAVILAGTVGFTGNLLILLSIATTPRLRTPRNAFVVNLSLVDLPLSIVFIPSHSLAILAGEWPMGYAVCRYSVKFTLLLWQVSLFTIAAIATDRYLLTTRPAETYHRLCGCRRTSCLLFYIWLQGVVVVCFGEFVIKTDIKYQTIFSSCAPNPQHITTHWYISALIGILEVTSLVVIPAQYIRVFLAMRASRQRVEPAVMLMNIGQAGQTLQDHARPGFPGPQLGITKSDIKVIKMSVLLTFVFVVSFLPLSIVFVFGVFSPDLLRGGRFGFFMLSIAPAINPFIYGWMNSNIRNACRRLLRCQRLFSRG